MSVYVAFLFSFLCRQNNSPVSSVFFLHFLYQVRVFPVVSTRFSKLRLLLMLTLFIVPRWVTGLVAVLTRVVNWGSLIGLLRLGIAGREREWNFYIFLLNDRTFVCHILLLLLVSGGGGPCEVETAAVIYTHNSFSLSKKIFPHQFSFV